MTQAISLWTTWAGAFQLWGAAKYPGWQAWYGYGLGLVVMLSCAVLIWQAVRILLRQREQLRRYSPSRLFFELCKAHRLNRPTRRLLWQLVSEQQLMPPARLFLEPQHLPLEAEKLPVALRPQHALLLELRGQLFAGLETAGEITVEAAPRIGPR